MSIVAYIQGNKKFSSEHNEHGCGSTEVRGQNIDRMVYETAH